MSTDTSTDTGTGTSTGVEPQTGAGGSATAPPTPPSAPPALSPVELARWAWRQLTSMRTALVLLFLLALAAVPGSVVPQANIDAVRLQNWQQAHPVLTPIYAKLGLFSVYDSAWFSAIYILLMVSLVGCIVPRLRIYWRGMRARPPRTPRNLSRLPESRTFDVDDPPDAVLARASAVLRKRHYRISVSPPASGSEVVSLRPGSGQATSSTTGWPSQADSGGTGEGSRAEPAWPEASVKATRGGSDTATESETDGGAPDPVGRVVRRRGEPSEPEAVPAQSGGARRRGMSDSALRADGGSVAAERGYLREAGNLLFHVSVLIVLVGFAIGQLFGYKGGVITVVGQGFSNSLSQYDDFAPGSLFNPDRLTPLAFTVDDFHVHWQMAGPAAGQPTSFAAGLTYTAAPGDRPHHYRLSVNHPLKVGGADVFLVGHGYAPIVTVRGGNGKVAYRGPVVFLPQDTSFESFGVIKAPDASPQQLGFEGLFLPTYAFSMARGPYSSFPDDLDPVLTLVPYHGNLGMDSGPSQNVYQLDKSHLHTFRSAHPRQTGPVDRIKLSPGQTVRLPHGAGSIRFDGVHRWVKLQVSHSPGKGIALLGVLLGILGLLGSLFIRPRRAWVRVASRDRRTVVELGGLDRSSGGDNAALADEMDELARLIGSGQEKHA